MPFSADNYNMMRYPFLILKTARRFLLSGVLFLFVYSVFAAAPLERGFALAPSASASKAEKDAAFWDARFKVLAIAGRYERTPYRYGGADRNGIDCSGLVYVSYKEALAVTIPRSARGLYDWAEKINRDMLQPGDLVFFKTDNSGRVTHVGIYAGGNRFIHSASAGTKTGVIYSDLDESYWARTFFAAGRALPGADSFAAHSSAAQEQAVAPEKTRKNRETSPPSAPRTANTSNFMMGFALAPTWNAFLSDGNIVRGFAGQIRLSVETHNRPMILGLELRPEWDGALGVFRVPLTLSLGRDNRLLFFAGPVLSFGDPVISVPSGDRHYSSGTTWFGAAGITASPFNIKVAAGDLAPYAEVAWQAYFISNSSRSEPAADFAAGFRISTGLRYTWRL
jgi:probable lipoprotein NlpC